MTRRLLVTYLSITAFALVILVVPLGLTFARSERDRLLFDIERDAAAVASLAEDALEGGRTPPLDATLADYRDRTAGRIVVVDTQGISVADSDRPEGEPRDYSTRPEIAAALDGDRVTGTRASQSLGGRIVYVAVPVASGGTVHGAVRITFPTASQDARVRDAWLRLGGLSILVLTVVAGVGLVLARSVTRPVRALEDAAERIADGDLAARVTVGHGPPEIRRLGATFNRTAAQLDQLVTAQQRFVADAAHQLRTPLTALRLRLENLEPHLPHAEAPRLDAAVAEVQRLSRIVDGLLVLARSDASHPPIRPVDLAAATAARVEDWSGAADAQGVALAARLPDRLWVDAPDGGVEQIVDNLVANAIAASPVGGSVTVQVAATRAGGELHVVDQGPGMSAADRERAFDRFWRGRAASPGSGLGLPIVRQLARVAGGDAFLTAGPGGRGLDAVVRLPAPATPRHLPPRRGADGTDGAQTLTPR
ncbi:MAG TPA: ATP-binding protein [Acidimicrobiales bacterium]|nr:ATP-binding protein [Acidimicrobiales bacterium]